MGNFNPLNQLVARFGKAASLPRHPPPGSTRRLHGPVVSQRLDRSRTLHNRGGSRGKGASMVELPPG